MAGEGGQEPFFGVGWGFAAGAAAKRKGPGIRSPLAKWRDEINLRWAVVQGRVFCRSAKMLLLLCG